MTKASELIAEVQKTEAAIRDEIASIVNSNLEQLTEATGLIITSVGINLIDATEFGNAAKKYILGGIDIDAQLPDKIGDA